MPILLHDDRGNKYPRVPADPTVVAQFGAGDTRVQRVWMSADGDAGPVELRVYPANPIPPGTVVGKESPDAATGRPAIALAFPDAASARLVLDYWRASLDAPRHAVPPAVRADPRYTLQADPSRPHPFVPVAGEMTCGTCGRFGGEDIHQRGTPAAPQKTAVERAQELMEMPGRDWPPKARDAFTFLSRKYGACMEVSLTAFAGYAQVCEGLPCDDPAYAASPELRAFLEGGK